MENKNKTGNVTIEIDLADICWRLLTQWKMILIVGIIMAAIIARVLYVRDCNAYNALVKSQQNKEEEQSSAKQSMEDNIAQILDTLEEDDRINVENVVQQKEMILQQKKYLDSSIFLNLDADHERQLNLQYEFVTADHLNEEKILLLNEAYSGFLKKDDVISAVKTEMGLSADNQFIRPLIKVQNDIKFSSGKLTGAEIDSLIITVILPNDSIDSEKVQKVLHEALMKQSETFSKDVIKHQLKLIQSVDIISVDKDVYDQKTEAINRIADLTTKYKNNRDGLSGVQLVAYQAIKSAQKGEQVDIEAVRQNISGIHKPDYKPVYFALGFIIGIILYVILFMIIIVLKETYYSLATLERMTGVRVLGELYDIDHNKGILKLFKSPFVERIRLKGKENCDRQTEKLNMSILSVCKHNHVKEITFVANHISTKMAENTISVLKETLTENNIKMEYISAEDLTDMMCADLKHVVVLVQRGTTKAREINALQKKLFYYDVENLGQVYYES